MSYSQLNTSDSDHEENFKNVELDDWHFVRQVQRRFPRGCLHIYSALVTILLFISLLSNHWGGSWRKLPSNSSQIYTSLGRNESYMMLEHEYDELWNEDLAGGEKVFDIPNEDGSQWSDEGSPAMVAMLHQLHCVAGIRKALQEGQEGKDIGNYLTNDHWPHCLDYLRRTILCWADDTFERPQKLRNGSFTDFIDGTSGQRTCRDKDALYELMRTSELYNDAEEEHHGHGGHGG